MQFDFKCCWKTTKIFTPSSFKGISLIKVTAAFYLHSFLWKSWQQCYDFFFFSLQSCFWTVLNIGHPWMSDAIDLCYTFTETFDVPSVTRGSTPYRFTFSVRAAEQTEWYPIPIQTVRATSPERQTISCLVPVGLMITDSTTFLFSSLIFLLTIFHYSFNCGVLHGSWGMNSLVALDTFAPDSLFRAS